MQPYIFPYIGYFQMIKAVDKFVFYDDVNFIKKGWVNRNRILVNGSEYLFTVPLLKMSQNLSIKESLINSSDFEIWKNKFIQTIDQNYKKAPCFVEVTGLIDSILRKPNLSISSLAIDSVVSISRYLEIRTEFKTSSETYQNKEMERQSRLIDICKQEGAHQYINALGGQRLYKKEDFMLNGIQLNFIKTLPIEYKQFKNQFVPWLSIIDVLMFNSKEEINQMLNQYELI